MATKKRTGRDIVVTVTDDVHERVRRIADDLGMPMGKFMLECALGGMPEVTRRLVEIRRREAEKEQKMAAAYARQLGEVEAMLAGDPASDTNQDQT